METVILVLAILALVTTAIAIWLATLVHRGRTQTHDLMVELTQVREQLQARQAVYDELLLAKTQLDKATDELARLDERCKRLEPLEIALTEAQVSKQNVIEQHSLSREDIARLKAELDSSNAELRSVKAKVAVLETEVVALTAHVNAGNAKQSALESDLGHEKSLAEEKLDMFRAATKDLETRFEHLANKIFGENSLRFATQNKTSLDEILVPLRSKLSEFQSKVEEVYVNESKDRSALGQQVQQLLSLNQSLSQDAKDLTSALKGSSKAQGNWGEMVLERLLEDAGLTSGREFEIQKLHYDDDGGKLYPDIIIRLPQSRNLVVDSKVSLIDYEQYVNAADDVARDGALKQHITSVKGHVRNLTSKNYQNLYGLQSLDFVVMFLPIESAYVAAVAADNELVLDAFKRNVLLVGPLSLLFVLRVVAQLWRQEAQTANAQEIAKRGAELYDKLVSFVQDLQKVGDQLANAQRSFDSASKLLSTGRGNVIRQAEMLKELGVKPTKALPLDYGDAGGSSELDAPNLQDSARPPLIDVDTP